MTALIETYRGFEISFDTDKETFIAYSNDYDKEGQKRSFSSVKKWVDDFLKENEVFKQVLLIGRIGTYKSKDKITLIGVRKDGRFVVQNPKNIEQLSKYDEEEYCLYDPKHDPVYEKWEWFNQQIANLKGEQAAYLEANYHPVLLSEYRKTITNNI